MMRFFKNVIYNCKQATLLSLKREEGKILFSERIKLFLHMLFCNACKHFVKQSGIMNKAGHHFHDDLEKHPTHILPSEKKRLIQQEVDDLYSR